MGHEARAGNALDLEDPRREAGPSGVVTLDGRAEPRDRAPPDEVDRRAAEAGSGETRRHDAVRRGGDLDERIELGRADLVEIPQRRMARREQPADLGEVMSGECRLRGED